MRHFEVAQLLLAKGADDTIRNNEGRLPRDYCSSAEWKRLKQRD
jgi:ankyrin repeat protein